jgi:uncharacterized protein YjbI with pentapeptide repeats
MTLREWLQLLIVPFALVSISFLFTMQQDARQRQIEDQRAQAERNLAEQRAQDATLQAYLDQMSTLMLNRNLLESEPSDPTFALAQARTSTVILRLDGAHNRSVTRFLRDSGLADDLLLSGIDLEGANLNDADLGDADLLDVDLSTAQVTQEQLDQAESLKGATMPDGQMLKSDDNPNGPTFEDWLKSKGSGEDGENTDPQ